MIFAIGLIFFLLGHFGIRATRGTALERICGIESNWLNVWVVVWFIGCVLLGVAVCMLAWKYLP